jgi:hypothetical protein
MPPYGCGIVQSWILIDVKEEVLVSAIMMIAGKSDFRKFKGTIFYLDLNILHIKIM